jgi:predicted RNase H-like nuclease (RuvC/YqgF family)
MFDFETTVAEIEWKVRKLVEENGRLRVEVEESAERCRELQEQVNNQNITINNLKEQNNILKLGNTLAQKGDTVEIKLRINQLIRSIDKSLALINKSE